MSLLETLGIQIVTVTAQKVQLTVPVTAKLLQPFGIVHGGVNAVLAESAASLGANAWLKANHFDRVATGTSLTTTHLNPVSSGTITATATPLKTGRTLQRWQVATTCQGTLTSQSLVTLLNTASNN